jgi:hypothetical protein
VGLDPAVAVVAGGPAKLARCSPHPAGNGRSSLSGTTRWSAHPPRIAAARSGASSARRRMRLTQLFLILSASAISVSEL